MKNGLWKISFGMILVYTAAAVSGCAHRPGLSAREPAAARNVVDAGASSGRDRSAGTSASSGPVEADPKWLTAVPTPIFRSTNFVYHGQPLTPYLLRKGDYVFVHSARTLWSPRVSGQAFFDTFLFGCEDLPPSPLDRVTSEGHLLHAGDGALIEEYPDHVASFGNQPVAWIRCEPY